MKFDRLNVIIALLIVVVLGLLFQNRRLNNRLTYLEGLVEDAISTSEEARNYAEEAKNYAEEASSNAFGNRCDYCPEEIGYR